MKSLEELKNSIYEKINEIRNFNNDDSQLLIEDGSYNPDELSAYLEREKIKNYMKCACMGCTEATGRSWDCHTRCDGYIAPQVKFV